MWWNQEAPAASLSLKGLKGAEEDKQSRKQLSQAAANESIIDVAVTSALLDIFYFKQRTKKKQTDMYTFLMSSAFVFWIWTPPISIWGAGGAVAVPHSGIIGWYNTDTLTHTHST